MACLKGNGGSWHAATDMLITTVDPHSKSIQNKGSKHRIKDDVGGEAVYGSGPSKIVFIVVKSNHKSSHFVISILYNGTWHF